MAANELKLKLEGPTEMNGFVDFEDFAKFCEAIAKCLKRSAILTGISGGEISFRVTDLKCASTAVTVRAFQNKKNKSGKNKDSRKEVLGFFRTTINGIEKGKIDPSLSRQDLELFREISSPLQKNVRKVKIGNQNITSRFASNIDSKLIGEGITSVGSVSGMLERVNVHERSEFVLYQPVTNSQITCAFSESLLDDVRAALKSQVTAYGTLFFKQGELIPHRVAVVKLISHPSDDELPTLHDLRKLGGWDTGGKIAIDFIRDLREELEEVVHV
jgi:DNA-binding XRE family transcriptional regulator